MWHGGSVETPAAAIDDAAPAVATRDARLIGFEPDIVRLDPFPS